MQKLISYGFLFLFVWQIVGFVGYFEFSHYRLKKDLKLLIKSGVPQDELIVFEFSPEEINELVWLKKNEFDRNGKLFDVVRSHIEENGSTYMECISDSQEKILFAHLDQSVSRNLGDEDNSNPISNWIKVLHFPVLAVNYTVEVDNLIDQSKEINNYQYIDLFVSRALNIDSPPPQFSC